MSQADRPSLLKRLFGTASPQPNPMDSATLRDYILGFCSQSEGARQYAITHLGRLVQNVQVTPPGTPSDRLLEMGAYMQITPAFRKFLNYGEIRGCYLGPLGRIDEKTVTSTSGETFSCFVDHFDAEKDRFPYPDNHFSTIICAELIEHLHWDPMHMMYEVNRILKPGGYMVLSTPNVCSLKSVSAILWRDNPGFYQHYMLPQPDGSIDPRHAREYAPIEIKLILEAAGFTVEKLDSGPDAWEPVPVEPKVQKLLTEYGYPTDLRGEIVHGVGRKTGPPVERHPKWLYD